MNFWHSLWQFEAYILHAHDCSFNQPSYNALTKRINNIVLACFYGQATTTAVKSPLKQFLYYFDSNALGCQKEGLLWFWVKWGS